MFGRIQELIRREKSPRYKRLSYVLKLVFTLGLLYLILKSIDLQSVIAQAAQLPLISAFCIMGLSVMRHFVQYVNWKAALHLNPGYIFQRRQVLASYVVALALRFVIPGGHGVFGKVFFLKNTSILASVIATTAERLFITWGTWAFAAIAAFFFFPGWNLLLRILLILIAAFLPLWAAVIMSLNNRFKQYLPAYTAQAPKMMLLQIANTLMMYLQYYIILNHLGVISALDTWLSMALTNVANSIPITISGLGLREGFAIHFLESYSFSSEQAVAATLTLFFFHDLIPAVVGAITLFRIKRV